MHYLTDRKRAEGRGAAHKGTEHQWFMTVSSVALVFLIPAFVYIFGTALGRPHDEVLATFARPVPAVVTALTLVAGMMHFHRGAKMMIQDYSHGLTRKALIMAAVFVSYTVMAAGLYALVRIAL
ncbi:succinate dehydrogenase [Rhodobacter veldkampii DSM 11550]|uniref:Succinate dehydrogenase n=1 Tax=Phaeovulum veldkampii DSM 11550 TaxID=1185920 RepID=A0A2T4JH16_9RHOB|nr:succinate dehydrogenase, hydrophobic membrane anchor protein [Phaeovulum veldkampii]MBK5945260.1 succinate dehydrogenase [Phaeovulum veldkampii DSM 11550]PTE17191.1 succinate dehydrogenase [Phaeovulum veldkampii DSM 11550]TDQ61448.1 succinate dehydrogenase / fumarate reductase membrane anchor subunit [Phaeovulum veldkampii DSM 11550]